MTESIHVTAHHGPCRLTGALALAALSLASAPAQAQQPARSPLTQGLLDLPPQAPAPAARRFATADGAVRFTFDRSGGRVALVRFEGEEKVYVLRPTIGPRGDEVFKTDTGEVLLRVTAQNGVVVFRDPRDPGAPATELGAAEPVPPPRTPRDLAAEMSLLERRMQAQLGRPVAFSPPPADPRAAGVVADAAAQAAEGLARSGAIQVRRVVIVFGPQPTAMLMPDGALRVVVTPELGYAGRPSADFVSRAVQGPER